MLIEINLLPKKEKKTFVRTLITSLVLVLILIIGSIYIIFTYQTMKIDIDSIQNQLQTTKQLRAIEEQKLVEYQSVSAVEELKATIDWAERIPISTVALLDHVTALLPERGFILNLSYSDAGTVHLTVQFDTNREVAYYLHELEHSEVIHSVQLRSMNTSGEELEKTNKNLKDKLVKIIVPRYVAVYDLELNRQALKNINSDKEDEQS